MTASTEGLHIRTGSRFVSETVELLSSMRFSISLLSVICIASVIGTVLKQHEPMNNYVNQFGPYWSDVFGVARLFTVYSAWWFLLILAFLVLSTSLCIARNTPKILVDFKAYKENIREQSLKAFPHRAESTLTETPETAAHRIGQTLLGSGWKVKLQSREGEAGKGKGWMVAAKTGSSNKIGYLAAHSAIVLVCIGGLLDGDLMVRSQMWFNGKTPFTGGGLIADVPPEHRISPRNPAFRGNLLVTEGTTAGTAILSQAEGVLLQDLPFSIELKKFIVEYHDNGMPRLFASDIVIHDHETGEKKEARVEVNHPASHRGINIYQSSFDDGGSRLTLQAVPINGNTRPFEISGTVGGSSALVSGDQKLTLEFTGLRVINVENMGGDSTSDASTNGAIDVRAVDLRNALERQLGAGHKPNAEKTLRNVGPSFSYKLRDAAGQAVEYNNYMLPLDIDGTRMFLLGMRETPSEPFRYLRVPVDENDSLDGFVRLRAALADPVLRELAISRYAVSATEGGKPELTEALRQSASRALGLFAGAEATPEKPGEAPIKGGLLAVSAFLEANVPEAERERASDVLVRILNGALFELLQVSRERAGLQPLPMGEDTAQFMRGAVLALSDAFYYPAPMTFKLKDFEHIEASVFQVARAPGQTIVYLGCILLIVGIFAMLYVRERRLWVWLAPSGDSSAQASMALSTNRKTMEADQEFEMLKTQLLKVNT
ncbi:MAG: cytochrome C biogenesis protein ResB [Comamonadaceae bacterium]|nr:cytochrome C biogenesis protein ResB [Comamonadaceae bacterium]